MMEENDKTHEAHESKNKATILYEEAERIYYMFTKCNLDYPEKSKGITEDEEKIKKSSLQAAKCSIEIDEVAAKINKINIEPDDKLITSKDIYKEVAEIKTEVEGLKSLVENMQKIINISASSIEADIVKEARQSLQK